MSDILTKVNQIGLNTEWPLSGQNNSSSVFRSNSRAILSGLTQAADELTRIQNTRLSFAGDAAGQSNRIGSAVVVGTSDPLMEVAFTLADVQNGPRSLDSRSQDYVINMDSKGRVILTTVYGHEISWAPGHSAGAMLNVEGNNLGSGTGSISVPTLGFNAQGRLISTGKATINYGLYDQTLTAGSLLVGNAQSRSTPLAPPPAQGIYSLVGSGTVLSWQAVGAGAVTGITAGEGIVVTPDPATPMVSLSLEKLGTNTNFQDSDLLVLQSGNGAKKVLFSDIYKIVKLNRDTNPALAGPLDVHSQPIQSSEAAGVVLKSNTSNTPKTTLTINDTGLTLLGTTGAPINLSAPVLTFNGRSWPTTVPTSGQYMTAGPNNTLIWSNPGTVTFQPIQNTFFVSNQGDDTSGNGSLVTPLKTINKALSLVPAFNAGQFTIVLMGGTYPEDINLTNIYNLNIEGMFQTTNARITGKVILNFNLKRIHFARIDLDNTATAADQPALVVTSGADELVFQDVNIIRANATDGAADFNGEVVKNVEFIGGSIRGIVNDNLTSADGYRVVYKNWDVKQDKALKIIDLTASRTLIATDNSTYIRLNSNDDNSLKVPEYATTPIPIGAVIQFSQVGVGRTSVVPLGNVLINTPDGFTLRKRFSKGTLTHVAPDIWDLSGDLDRTISIAPVTRADSDTVSADNDKLTADNG